MNVENLDTLSVGAGIWILTAMIKQAFPKVEWLTRPRIALGLGLIGGAGLAYSGQAPGFASGMLQGLISTAIAAYGHDFVAKPVAAKVGTKK
jgi:hypothetical protein